VGEAYTHQFEADGGSPPYYFHADTPLPPGLVLEDDGRLHGIPTLQGDYSFQIQAWDSVEGSASRVYAMSVAAAEPTANADAAITPSQQPVTIAVTANDSGMIDAIAIASAPAHGTATVDGLDVVYQPAGTFHGDDVFTYIASGPNGASAPAADSIRVTPLAPTAGLPQSGQTPPGL